MKPKTNFSRSVSLFFLFFFTIATLGSAQGRTDEFKYCGAALKAKLTNAKDANVDDAIAISLQALNGANENCKVELYNFLADCYNTKLLPQKELEYLNKGIALASSQQYNELSGTLHLRKFSYFLDQSKSQDAVNNLDSAAMYIKTYASLDSITGYLTRKSTWFRSINKFDSAENYLQKALVAAENQKDTAEAHIILNNLGNYFMTQGKLDEAIKYCLRSLKYKELINEQQSMPATLIIISNCYQQLGQNQTSFDYALKANALSRKIGNNDYLYMSFIMLGKNASRNPKDSTHGLAYIDSAIRIASKINNKSRIASSKSLKADMLFLNDLNPQEAIQLSQEAIAIFKELGLKFNLCNTYFSVGRYHANKKNLNEAVPFLQQSLALAKETGQSTILIKVHQLLSDVFENKGDFKAALFHHQQFFKLQDSLQNGKLKADMAELEKKYTIGKKETEIAMLSKDKLVKDAALKQANTKQSFFLVTSLILAAFMAAGFWAYRKLRNSKNLMDAKNAELDNLNQVKNRLFSIIAHDVKGLSIPFQRAARVLNHHIQKQNFEKTIEVAQQLETNAESLSNLLDNLLQWSLEQMNGYLPKPEMLSLKNEINSIIESYAGHAQFKKIEISQNIPEDLSVETDKGAFHVIFRNLVANAIKYTENGSIQINASKDNKNIICHVKDSGTGIDASVVSKLFGIDSAKIKNGTAGEKGSGLGLVLVKKFVDMNGGTINVNSIAGAGTDFVISFPLRVAV